MENSQKTISGQNLWKFPKKNRKALEKTKENHWNHSFQGWNDLAFIQATIAYFWFAIETFKFLLCKKDVQRQNSGLNKIKVDCNEVSAFLNGLS